MRRWAMLVAAGLAAGCTEQIVCPTGQSVCDGRCVELQLDAANCGACGTACAAGEACKAGACTDCAAACGDGQTCEHGVCRADLYVACFATDEVVGATKDLVRAGPARTVDDGPIALAWTGDQVWAAHGYTTPTLVGFTPGVPGNVRHTLGGDYLNAVRASGGLLYVASHAGTLVVVDPVDGVKDEVALGLPGVEVNPRGVAVTGTRVALALYGNAFSPSFAQQSIAVADVTASPTCATPPCGSVLRKLDLDVPAAEGVVGAYDPPGFPFPSGAVAIGTRVFVTLANLAETCNDYGCYYGVPAGHGRLAAFDTFTSDDAAFVDLGEGCTNPGQLAVDGTTLWIACGGTGTILPVDVAGAAPAPGAPVPMPIVPGAIAACSGQVFVGDQYSGQVARVAASGGEVTAAPLCTGGDGFDLAADLLCAGGTP